jgi:uncharacterized protein YodC (DUF2158 family)
MAGQNVRVGEVVRLKSGGPPMTAGVRLTNGDIPCQWFVGPRDQREVRSGNFPADCLEPTKPDHEIDHPDESR